MLSFVSKGYWRVIAGGRVLPSTLQRAAVLQRATAPNSMWQQAAGSTQHQAASPSTPLWRLLLQSTSDENPPCDTLPRFPQGWMAIRWHYSFGEHCLRSLQQALILTWVVVVVVVYVEVLGQRSQPEDPWRASGPVQMSTETVKSRQRKVIKSWSSLHIYI